MASSPRFYVTWQPGVGWQVVELGSGSAELRDDDVGAERRAFTVVNSDGIVKRALGIDTPLLGQ